MLMAGWKTAYVAESAVMHSHNYSIAAEFKRYFDIGVCHSRESWLLEQFGTAYGEGKQFVISEMRSLFPENLRLIPSVLLRSLAKFIGYNLGRKEAWLQTSLKRKLSMHKRFWD
jgi:rhamnosyltransferase